MLSFFSSIKRKPELKLQNAGDFSSRNKDESNKEEKDQFKDEVDKEDKKITEKSYEKEGKYKGMEDKHEIEAPKDNNLLYMDKTNYLEEKANELPLYYQEYEDVHQENDNFEIEQNKSGARLLEEIVKKTESADELYEKYKSILFNIYTSNNEEKYSYLDAFYNCLVDSNHKFNQFVCDPFEGTEIINNIFTIFSSFGYQRDTDETFKNIYDKCYDILYFLCSNFYPIVVQNAQSILNNTYDDMMNGNTKNPYKLWGVIAESCQNRKENIILGLIKSDIIFPLITHHLMNVLDDEEEWPEVEKSMIELVGKFSKSEPEETFKICKNFYESHAKDLKPINRATIAILLTQIPKDLPGKEYINFLYKAIENMIKYLPEANQSIQVTSILSALEFIIFYHPNLLQNKEDYSAVLEKLITKLRFSDAAMEKTIQLLSILTENFNFYSFTDKYIKYIESCLVYSNSADKSINRALFNLIDSVIRKLSDSEIVEKKLHYILLKNIEKQNEVDKLDILGELMKLIFKKIGSKNIGFVEESLKVMSKVENNEACIPEPLIPAVSEILIHIGRIDHFDLYFNRIKAAIAQKIKSNETKDIIFAIDSARSLTVSQLASQKQRIEIMEVLRSVFETSDKLLIEVYHLIISSVNTFINSTEHDEDSNRIVNMFVDKILELHFNENSYFDQDTPNINGFLIQVKSESTIQLLALFKYFFIVGKDGELSKRFYQLLRIIKMAYELIEIPTNELELEALLRSMILLLSVIQVHYPEYFKKFSYKKTVQKFVEMAANSDDKELSFNAKFIHNVLYFDK